MQNRMQDGALRGRHFMLGGVKGGHSWKTWLREGCELGEGTGETQQGLGVGSPLGVPVFGDEVASVLEVEGGHLSQEGPMTCFRGGQRVLPAPALPQIPSLEIVRLPGCRVLGWRVLNPVRTTVKSAS